MKARTVAALAMVLLFLLILAWHFVIAPPSRMPAALAAALHAAVLLPGLILLAARRRSATFWGGLAALFLFSHGVMEAWTSPAVRLLAFGELALSVLIVVAASWDGMRARFAGKRGGV
jgi:uncharacterized membrane protein